jgi:hypothetical protein
VGQAANFLEEAGFSTVVLTPTHEFNRTVGIPRSLAIEYPYGRLLGQVGDSQGQRDVLLAALTMLTEADAPGMTRHLPLTWPEAPKDTHWHPPEMSPIIKAHLDEIKKVRRK